MGDWGGALVGDLVGRLGGSFGETFNERALGWELG